MMLRQVTCIFDTHFNFYLGKMDPIWHVSFLPILYAGSDDTTSMKLDDESPWWPNIVVLVVVSIVEKISIYTILCVWNYIKTVGMP